MTTPIASGDPMVALATLLVDRDNLRAALDDESIRAARDEQHRALSQQISLLHEAADDVRTGAWVEGGLALGGGVLSAAGGAVCHNSSPRLHDALTGSGTAARDLAAPLGKLFGDAPKADAEADAKQAEADAADAEARAAEAQHHRDRVDESADRALSTIGATLESEAQPNLAIISKM